MTRVRSLIARTRLEATKVHPMLAALGGKDGWAAILADAKVGMGDGRYDSRDMPMVIAVLKSWITS